MVNGTPVRIDRDGCISCGICWNTCADVFEENPNDNRSQVVEAYRTSGEPAEGSVPPRLEACAQEAAESCPVSVISVG